MMRELNHAIEEVREFEEFKRRIEQPLIEAHKLPGETRKAYRARLRAEAKQRAKEKSRAG